MMEEACCIISSKFHNQLRDYDVGLLLNHLQLNIIYYTYYNHTSTTVIAFIISENIRLITYCLILIEAIENKALNDTENKLHWLIFNFKI